MFRPSAAPNSLLLRRKGAVLASSPPGSPTHAAASPAPRAKHLCPEMFSRCPPDSPRSRVRSRKINAVNGALTSGPFFRKATPAGTRVWNSNFRPPTVNNPCLVGRSLAWDEDGFWLTARRAVPTRGPFVTTRPRAVNTGVRGRRLEAFQRNSTIGAVFCVFSISRLAKRIYSCAGGLLTTGSLFARLSAEA